MIQKKKKLRKGRVTNIFVFAFLAIFILGFIFMLVFSNFQLRKRRAEVLRKIEQIQEEIQKLEKESQTFEVKIFEQETEEYLERQARERFGLKKPGEKKVVILEPEQEQPSSSVQPEKTKKSFWQNLLEFFQSF